MTRHKLRSFNIYLVLVLLFAYCLINVLPAFSTHNDRLTELSEEHFQLRLFGSSQSLHIYTGKTAIYMNERMIPPESCISDAEITLTETLDEYECGISAVLRVVENLEHRLGQVLVTDLLEGRNIYILPFVPGLTTLGADLELGGYTDGCAIFVGLTKLDKENQRDTVDISNRLIHEIAHLYRFKRVPVTELRRYLKEVGFDYDKRYATNKDSNCTLEDWAENPEEWFAEGFRYAFGTLGTDCFQSPIEDLNPERAAKYFSKIGSTNYFIDQTSYDGGYKTVYCIQENGNIKVSRVREPLNCFRYIDNVKK